PERQRELPQQELARALRQRVVEDLHVLAVGSVEADLYARDEDLAVLAVVGVEGVAVRPAVVRLPGVVAALEKEVGRPVVADDEDDIALIAVLLRRQLAEVDAADPGLRDLEGDRPVPAALAQPEFADRRRLLRLAREGAEGGQVPAALALVVAEAVQLDAEIRRRVGADEKLDPFAGADASA